MERIKDIPGDMAEFGCFEGGITMQLAELGRRVWAWDTFEGMPDDDYIEAWDNSDPPGKWKPGNDPLQQFKDSGFDIVPVVGKFSETIPRIELEYPDLRFSFVHVDCDHYHAYRRVLAYLTSHMSPGGVVKLDDYGCCKGAQIATDEWLATHNKQLFEGDKILF